jgi:glycosyltransferase involved in cell wall biosynthesis
VRCIYQNNRGPAGARNRGIEEASGELIAFLDSDDLWLPDKLRKQISVIDRSSNVGAVYCNFRSVDAQGSLIPGCFDRTAPGDLLCEKLMYANVVSGSDSSVLVRRSCLSDTGLFDETIPVGEDQDLWRRLALKYCFEYIDEVLVLIRRHDGNLQNSLCERVVGLVRYVEKLKRDTPPAYRHHLPEVIYRSYLVIAFQLLETILAISWRYRLRLCLRLLWVSTKRFVQTIARRVGRGIDRSRTKRPHKA